VVTYTREVLHTAATNKHDAVLLEVVTFARDVGVDLFGVGETYTGHLPHSGVRLFRGRRIDPEAYATLLRTRIQRTRLAFYDKRLASFAN
jgi:hypothetical protein